MIVGCPHKSTTTLKWARQAERKGKGKIVDAILYWYADDLALFTHVERDQRTSPNDRSSVEWKHRQSGYAGPVVIQAEHGLS